MAQPKTFDAVDFIIRYESGRATIEETIEGFQHLIDAGTVWSLQGHYGRAARNLIDNGYCTDNSN